MKLTRGGITLTVRDANTVRRLQLSGWQVVTAPAPPADAKDKPARGRKKEQADGA
ncbi:MAG TPA: hypothetical protein VKY39_05300 [Aggregatilineales bacterium]|nr:hypothetical protein [Aggregatilineales bacterium]